MVISLDAFILTMSVTALAYFYPVFIFLRDMRDEWKKANKMNTINYLISILLLLFNYAMIFFVFITAFINQDQGLADFLNMLMMPIVIFWIIILATTAFFHLAGIISLRKGVNNPKASTLKDKKDHENDYIDIRYKIRRFELKLQHLHSDKPVIEDIKRKFWHFLFLVLLWVGAFSLIDISLQYYPEWHAIYASRFWEYNSENPGELFFFIRFVIDPRILIDNSVIHAGLMLTFMIAGYITCLMEAIRHSKHLYSPTNLLVAFFIREGEYDTLATYFQMALSMSFAAFILPPLLTFAIMGVLCVADTAASQIGIRWGRNKLPINKKKSWQGIIAGSVTALLLTIPIIGLFYAIVTTVVYFIIDFFTEYPIPVSDNLGIPVSLTLVFLILNLFSIPYSYAAFLPWAL